MTNPITGPIAEIENHGRTVHLTCTNPDTGVRLSATTGGDTLAVTLPDGSRGLLVDVRTPYQIARVVGNISRGATTRDDILDEVPDNPTPKIGDTISLTTVATLAHGHLDTTAHTSAAPVLGVHPNPTRGIMVTTDGTVHGDIATRWDDPLLTFDDPFRALLWMDGVAGMDETIAHHDLAAMVRHLQNWARDFDVQVVFTNSAGGRLVATNNGFRVVEPGRLLPFGGANRLGRERMELALTALRDGWTPEKMLERGVLGPVPGADKSMPLADVPSMARTEDVSVEVQCRTWSIGRVARWGRVTATGPLAGGSGDDDTVEVTFAGIDDMVPWMLGSNVAGARPVVR